MLTRICRQRLVGPLIHHPSASMSTSAPGNPTENTKIEIPKAIPRGPTDILRALESTVGRDPTAAHYKYHDDPYLIPMSNMGKRTFAMAQEAGRKAAQWIRKEHADLFQHKVADPQIEAYFPPMVYTENSEVDETDLKKLIASGQVSDAKLVYKMLLEKGQKIDPESEQGLLELLCFQNADDRLSEELIEERWFRQSSKAKEKQSKTWKYTCRMYTFSMMKIQEIIQQLGFQIKKSPQPCLLCGSKMERDIKILITPPDGDLAEEIFIGLNPPSSRTYAALIQGMVKYHQVNRAWELYEESQEKNLILNTNTMNALISVANVLKESYDLRWTLIANLLQQMNRDKLRPNLGTLNAVLQSLGTCGSSQMTKQNALRTLSEFKKLGIEPSLATYYHLLVIFCKDRGPTSTILNDIMTQIEDREHPIRDLKDTNFFVTAMDVCCNHLRDVELGKRVNKLLHHKHNYDLIGSSYKESIYFRHYFTLLCTQMPFDEFMKDIYYKLVPHIYVPEPSVMYEVLRQLDVNAALEYIPRLWSDMIIFDHIQRENLVHLILEVMVQNINVSVGAAVKTQQQDTAESDLGGKFDGPAGIEGAEAKTQQDAPESDLGGKFSNIAWDMYERLESASSAAALRGGTGRINNRISITGDLLGRILLLIAKNKDFEKACVIMEKLDKDQQNITGVPSIEALSEFVDLCIETRSPLRAITCIQYCADLGFPEANMLAARLNEKLSLDENHLERLSKIVNVSFK